LTARSDPVAESATELCGGMSGADCGQRSGPGCPCGLAAGGQRIDSSRAAIGQWAAVSAPIGGLLLGAVAVPGDLPGAVAGGCGLLAGILMLNFIGEL